MSSYNQRMEMLDDSTDGGFNSSPNGAFRGRGQARGHRSRGQGNGRNNGYGKGGCGSLGGGRG